MQALGAYQGGRMLFLGLGTGMGSALVVLGVLQPTELAHLPYKEGMSYEDFVGITGLERLGEARWKEEVTNVVGLLKEALAVDYVVLGGGNVKKLDSMPPGARRGNNADAFTGGFRLWEEDAPRRPHRRAKAASPEAVE
jgi:polyphosphate glucokinase